ncbi:MAG: DNA mismatch repair endonuclease MutL [Bacteroidetes bacterium]|nr:DNA mismatch repair endonuclease MutL [Bacteroidota bacterium]
MDIIQLLPDHVANQIAAGEVIQRPSSAVKEMLENALDAGSTEIKLFIKDAGKTLLQVVDNGSGMSKADLKMCFERHATSKIKSADDLFNIQSMGFRGEAMASIAAIAHVEVTSKLTDKELGTHLIIEGSKITTHEDCASSNGTSMKVKNLFYNVPARRNFLKSDQVEMRHIVEEFTRIALANPKVKMQLFHNNSELFHLPSSNLRQRIVNIIGDKKNETLVPIEEETTLVKITGFVGKPEAAKRTRGEQYFFVNKRFIKSQYLHHAVSKAFEEVIPYNYFPSYFINLNIDPKLIDINIHPTKTEIKFEDENAIYAIIRATVKRSLGAYNIAPSLDFSQELSFDLDFSNKEPKTLRQPTIKVDSTYNPFEKKSEYKLDAAIEKEWKQPTLSEEFDSNNELNELSQIGNHFIAVPNENGLLLIHQRRAHKRILFEYFKNILSQQKGQSQQLLFPKEINLNNTELEFIVSMQKELNAVGFIFEFKDSTLVISGIPPECQEENLHGIIENLIEQAKNSEQLNINQKDNLAKSLATSLAISEFKKLADEEMKSLKNELLKCKSPSVCPSGKRTMINLKTADLEKYF